MPVVNGNTILLKIGDNEIGSQRGVTMDSSTEMIDLSSKAGDDGIFLPGKRTDTVSLSTLYVEDDATGYGLLRTAYEGNSPVILFWAEGNSDVKTNTTSYVTSLSISAPHNGPAEMEVSLQVSGGWTDVA